MRHQTHFGIAAVLLLAAGCASAPADAGDPKAAISIEAFERGEIRGVPLIGPHAYLIRVKNRSAGSIVVDSIRIDPRFGGAIELVDGSQLFEDTMAAGSTADFDMSVTIQASPDFSVGPNARLSSLHVQVGFHTEPVKKDFYESCTCGIKRTGN
jgi:hypothetical protein